MLHADKPCTHRPIGLIGAGRLARALAWRLHAVGCRVHAVASRSEHNMAALAAPIAHCTPCAAQAVADACELVFITTPDAAIQTTVQAITWRKGQGVVHCSGATDVAVLQKAQDDGAHIGGFHPLQSFADPVVAAQTLAGCTITIQAQEPLQTVLTTLAQRLGCAVHILPEDARAAYHAAASFASQHINVLLAQAVGIWQSWGASEEAAAGDNVLDARPDLTFPVSTGAVHRSASASSLFFSPPGRVPCAAAVRRRIATSCIFQ